MNLPTTPLDSGPQFFSSRKPADLGSTDEEKAWTNARNERMMAETNEAIAGLREDFEQLTSDERFERVSAFIATRKEQLYEHMNGGGVGPHLTHSPRSLPIRCLRSVS